MALLLSFWNFCRVIINCHERGNEKTNSQITKEHDALKLNDLAGLRCHRTTYRLEKISVTDGTSKCRGFCQIQILIGQRGDYQPHRLGDDNLAINLHLS